MLEWGFRMKHFYLSFLALGLSGPALAQTMLRDVPAGTQAIAGELSLVLPSVALVAIVLTGVFGVIRETRIEQRERDIFSDPA